MVGILGRPVRLWHVLIVGVLALVLAGSTLVLAGSGNVFFPSGKIRMASAWSDESRSASGSDVPPVRMLSANFTVPAGKRADIQATFSASLLPNPGQFAYCFGRFTLDGPPSGNNVFRPGPQQLIGGETANMPNGLSAAMTGYKKGVRAGSHTVHVYVGSAFAGCTLQERALNVLVNVH